MRFNGGAPLSWSRLERILSGRPGPEPVPVGRTGMLPGAGPVRPRRSEPQVPFVELHAVSSYSFLDGASEPEDLVARAADLGLNALGLLDRDGFYGAVKFAEAAAAVGLDTVFGAELTLDQRVLPVIARGPEGYRRLSHLMADAHMATREKDAVAYPPLELIGAELDGTCVVLAGWQWIDEIDHLVETFGQDNVVREYEVSMTPEDTDRHAMLDRFDHLPAIVTAMPAAATREQARLAAAKRALARREALAQAHGDLHPMGANWLRSGEQLERMLPGCKHMLDYSVELAKQCAFTLNLVAPELPRYPTPSGRGEMDHLRDLTLASAQFRYATRSADVRNQAMKQIRYELSVIEELNFPGYFLIIYDLSLIHI